MSKSKGSTSKRQTIREKRRQQQRQRRLYTILIITLAALVVAGLLIAPSIRNALTPVGEIKNITPRNYPMVDGKTLGDPSAPVKVEVYEDFQCPSCRTFSNEIEPLIVDNYVATGTIQIIFRHFPFLDDRAAGKESDQSANASMCAADQGRFWDYKDILFANWDGENQGAFSDKRLVAFAQTLGLDMEAFQACFESNRFQEVIDEDLAAGRNAGVSGTPSIFVNGEHVTPGFVPSYIQLSQAIEAALGSSSN